MVLPTDTRSSSSPTSIYSRIKYPFCRSILFRTNEMAEPAYQLITSDLKQFSGEAIRICRFIVFDLFMARRLMPSSSIRFGTTSRKAVLVSSSPCSRLKKSFLYNFSTPCGSVTMFPFSSLQEDAPGL